MTVRFPAMVCAIASLASIGCLTTIQGRVVDLYKETGLPRASFELHCPASDISVQALSLPPERDYRLLRGERPFPMNGDAVGVRGCGREAVYLYSNRYGWISNTDGSRLAR